LPTLLPIYNTNRANLKYDKGHYIVRVIRRLTKLQSLRYRTRKIELRDIDMKNQRTKDMQNLIVL